MSNGVMLNKLIQDFFEADKINKMITTTQLPLEQGIPILKDMTQDVIDDISILDQETYNKLNEKTKQLNTTNNQRKQELTKQTTVEDDIDKRNLKLKLLKEDHSKYRRLHIIIQEICYRKGWFE